MTADHASSEEPTRRGWLLIGADGVVDGIDVALAAALGAGGPASVIGGWGRDLLAPSSQHALGEIESEARRGRGWRGQVEFAVGRERLRAEVDAVPRRLGGFELRLTFVPVVGSVAKSAARSDAAREQPHELPHEHSHERPDERATGTLAEVMAEVAHQLNNPLAAIAGYAQSLAALSAEEQARALAVIEAEARRAGRIVHELGRFALEDAPGLEASDLGAAVGRALEAVREPVGAPPVEARRAARVLVVDDEASIRTLAVQVLATVGYEPSAAATAEEALVSLEETRFDAIVTDIRMPGMDGVAFHGEVARRWPRLARRVVIISGDVQNEAVSALATAYGLPALEKPFRLEALRAALEQVLASDAVEADR